MGVVADRRHAGARELNLVVRAGALVEGEVSMRGEGEGAVVGDSIAVCVARLGVVLYHVGGRVGGVGGQLGDVGGGRA